MSYDHWVCDVSIGDVTLDGPWCFCPVDGDPYGEHSIVVGLNFISDRPPSGELIGFFHHDGQEALDRWVKEYDHVARKIWGISHPAEEET